MTTISKIGFTLVVQLAYPIIIVISGRQGSLTQELVAYRVVGEGVFNYLLCHPLAWSPAHLFTIRRRQKEALEHVKYMIKICPKGGHIF